MFKWPNENMTPFDKVMLVLVVVVGTAVLIGIAVGALFLLGIFSGGNTPTPTTAAVAPLAAAGTATPTISRFRTPELNTPTSGTKSSSASSVALVPKPIPIPPFKVEGGKISKVTHTKGVIGDTNHITRIGEWMVWVTGPTLRFQKGPLWAEVEFIGENDTHERYQFTITNNIPSGYISPSDLPVSKGYALIFTGLTKDQVKIEGFQDTDGTFRYRMVE